MIFTIFRNYKDGAVKNSDAEKTAKLFPAKQDIFPVFCGDFVTFLLGSILRKGIYYSPIPYDSSASRFASASVTAAQLAAAFLSKVG